MFDDNLSLVLSVCVCVRVQVSLVIRHQVNTSKAKSSLMFQGSPEGQMLRGTCRRGSDQLPEESDSPRPVELTCPWASEGTGPAAAGYLHTQSLERPRLHSDTHPAETPNDLMHVYEVIGIKSLNVLYNTKSFRVRIIYFISFYLFIYKN